MERCLAIGVVRARQIGDDARLSDYEAFETAWATRRRLHCLIGISRDLFINTGNTLEGRNAGTRVRRSKQLILGW